MIHGEPQKDIEETLKRDGRQSPPIENIPGEGDSGIGETSSTTEVKEEINDSPVGRKESTTYEIYPAMVYYFSKIQIFVSIHRTP